MEEHAAPAALGRANALEALASRQAGPQWLRRLAGLKAGLQMQMAATTPSQKGGGKEGGRGISRRTAWGG